MHTYIHAGFKVHQEAELKDNYAYFVEGRQFFLCIDPPTLEVVERVVRNTGIRPTHLLNTHHHWDHAGANEAIKRAFHTKVVAPGRESIAAVDVHVFGGERLELDGLHIDVMHVPGHTLGHVAYRIADALFCGDTLFGAGCGRLFEGTPEQMWESLNKIACLHPQTKVYCAHEYTLNNLRFALTLLPDHEGLKTRFRETLKKRENHLPSVPSTLAEELQTNPFYWPLQEEFRKSYAASHGIKDDPVSVFAHLRLRRDRW